MLYNNLSTYIDVIFFIYQYVFLSIYKYYVYIIYILYIKLYIKIYIS